MINLLNICTFVENQLRAKSNYKRKYNIYAEAEYHKQAERVGNTIETFIEGIATTINSSIVPVSGLNFGTQVIGFELAIPIDHEAMYLEGIETIVNAYKQDIDAFVSNPQTTTLNGYVVTVTGTLAEVGEPQTQSNIGLMIPIDFTLTFNYFENGVNSTQEELIYFGKEIKFTSLSFGRTVIQDGGAFNNTNGTAKNYVQTTALSIELVMPALSDCAFCKKFYNFLLTGENEPFDIRYRNKALTPNADDAEVYTVIFLSSNLQAQGVDNVGYTITLAEAL